jgi:hypothetical protein
MPFRVIAAFTTTTPVAAAAPAITSVATVC